MVLNFIKTVEDIIEEATFVGAHGKLFEKNSKCTNTTFRLSALLTFLILRKSAWEKIAFQSVKKR